MSNLAQLAARMRACSQTCRLPPADSALASIARTIDAWANEIDRVELTLKGKTFVTGSAPEPPVDPLETETRAATSRGAHSTEDAGRSRPSSPPADTDPATARALDALDTLGDLWASEVDLTAMVIAIDGTPDRAHRMRALAIEAFIEGAYRGRTSLRASQPPIACTCHQTRNGDIECLVHGTAPPPCEGLDTPWPLRDVLAKLIDATEHLLDDHNCDTHGHEEYRAAVNAGKALQQRRAAQPPSADARDAARWRQANADICWSFDGSDRTYYLKAVGRESFEQTIDKRIALTKPDEHPWCGDRPPPESDLIREENAG